MNLKEAIERAENGDIDAMVNSMYTISKLLMLSFLFGGLTACRFRRRKTA